MKINAYQTCGSVVTERTTTSFMRLYSSPFQCQQAELSMIWSEEVSGMPTISYVTVPVYRVPLQI